MDPVRILLVPAFTELEWTIKPQLEQWAEVASYDPPGIGDEPPPAAGAETVTRTDIAQRGLDELDRRGWDRFVLLGDGWGIATAAMIAVERPSQVEAIAFGHAVLSYDVAGERAPVNGATHDAMSQLLTQDAGSFIRYGIAQLTQGGYDEELADRMVARLRGVEGTMSEVWSRLTNRAQPAAELLADLDCPMLFAKHDGCLAFTPEGFEDATKAFPQAATLVIDSTPCTSDEFAAAVRELVSPPGEPGTIAP